LNRAVALCPPALDLGPPLPLGALLLVPLALEPLGDRLGAVPERDYLGVAAAQPQTGCAWRRTLA
jgi:hypothetical protein